MRAAPTTIVIADCQPAVISGVVHELQRNPGIEVVGTVRGPSGLIEALDRCRCDVMVFDCAMLPSGDDQRDGDTVISLIRRDHRDIGLVAFTMIDDPVAIRVLLAQGISCIFSKRDDLDEMPTAIRAAKAKVEYLSPFIASVVQNSGVGGFAPPHSSPLTPRELEVTRLFVSGLTINEIAARLSRRKQTVSAQKWNAMRKLGMERDVDLIRYAIDMKLF
ncbi:response regulator transcription factor [Burkholderia ubonensis]|uniref:response regulator transcription factor n=1 Tax=Burkholderia ubonensis TaxID=101571 RepID=UPI00075A4B8F|nr:response regulator transcription factor [Burkholderia ubonensis]KVC73112.1 LuxR family transcriptional regulator [Burkholderia ubonensis]